MIKTRGNNKAVPEAISCYADIRKGKYEDNVMINWRNGPEARSHGKGAIETIGKTFNYKVFEALKTETTQTADGKINTVTM